MNLALALPEAETFSLASAMILPRLNRQLRLPPINFTKKKRNWKGNCQRERYKCRRRDILHKENKKPNFAWPRAEAFSNKFALPQLSCRTLAHGTASKKYCTVQTPARKTAKAKTSR